VHDLLRDAAELVPGVLELEIEEAIAGLRPGTPDNAPVIGRSPIDPRIVWATGHYRNGVLLAPVTADLVVAELAGEPVEHAFGPERFAAPGGSNVGLPPSGRGRTDGRRSSRVGVAP
jgi:glycine oxidase